MKKTLLLSLVGLLTCLTTMGQLPTKGKYYRIVNANYGTAMKEDWEPGNVICAATKDGDYSQLWQYTSSGALQNVFTGKYIQNQPYGSSIFTTAKTAKTVTFATASDGHLLISTAATSNYMHCDAASNVVNWWDTNAEGNHWEITEIALTQEEVDAARAKYNEMSNFIGNATAYNTALQTFYTNDLCTELKPEYQNMTDEALSTAMTTAGLPTALVNVALKIKNQWWTNTDASPLADDNTYARDFRVATYKPYSDANKWNSRMNVNFCSYMGNPTGIYASNNELIHIFVGNDIPEGTTLYITPLSGWGIIGSNTTGTQLKKGYNVVAASNDNITYFINYVATTLENGTPTKKLSEYPALDIHIEGGKCIGYYEKASAKSSEDDAKYQYLLRQTDANNWFVVKGEMTIFYFPAVTYKNINDWKTSIWNSINWFDKVKYWEMGILGVVDDVANGLCENGLEYSRSGYPTNITGGDSFFPSYCNNPSMAIQGADDTNPHASDKHTSYPGTWGVESSFNADCADFDTWCTGHEHGHSIQYAYNLESCTESSVNLGSLVINYLTGYRMSRGGTFDNNYAYSTQNMVFGHRDIGMTMRMYYNLYLYYHTAARKKDFYPTFVKLLRDDPMDWTANKWIDGVNHHRATKSWIKLYKHACEAAKEDLTEYFRLWGFFVPCDEVFFGDYANYYVSLSQKEIDDAIAEVKAKNYPENLQIMFMEDRQLLRPRKDIWASTATGEQKNQPDNNGAWKSAQTLQDEYGNVGDVLTFLDGSGNTSEYKYILSGNKVSLSGNGGVGFIVYDNDGNIAYMSNRYEFEIPAALASDGFTIRAINADGSSSEVTNNADNASDAEKREILQNALALAAEYTALEDATGKKVGFYSSKVLATLKGLVTDANAAISNNDVNNYLALANSINNEVLRLKIEELHQKIEPNGMYTISSVRKISNNTRYLTGSTNNITAGTSGNSNSVRWTFVACDNIEDTYYVQNRNTRKLMGASLDEKSKITGVKMVEEIPREDAQFKIVSLGNGIFTLRPKDAINVNIDPSANITVWNEADEGSQWYITLYDTFEVVTDKMITDKITHANDLINDVCNYSTVQNEYTLQVNDATQAGYLSANQTSDNYPLSRAIDGKNSTYFMSNRNNNDGTTEYHHLKVDLGQGVKTKSMQFQIYGNRNYNYAKTIVVYGSNSGSSWTNVATVSIKLLNFTSNLIAPNTEYRYWRFDVVDTEKKYADNSPYPWFTANEFAVYKVEEVVEFKTGFESLPKSNVTNLMKKINDAQAQVDKDFRTPLSDYYFYNQLNTTYNTLYNKAVVIDPTVDINDIEADEKADGNDIYDLTGRRLNNANGNGVYIINGKKVVKN